MREAMQPLALYASAEELERYLGDPADLANVFSFARSIELDERDEYPEQACELLNAWDFHHYYIPQEYGGKLKSFEELISLVRVIARRDLTVAVAHVKTYLGAVAIWVAGAETQRRKMARIIKNGGQVALGLTERAHGSDILANETQAAKTADGYALSGEKWLINNATRSAAMTVFVRTDNKVGPRDFSLLLFEKDGAPKSSYTHLPRVKTHGLRGADISGIRFHGCELPSDALIGPPGSGLEIALKKLQITRSIVPALSLGAADTALRATMSFALARKLYGDTVFAIPHARKTLVDAFLDLLICECMTTATARAIHVLPQQMSVLSAVAKYYVPVTIESMIRSLSLVLGARSYLREVHWSGIFQKLIRDNAIASLFDGSTVVNLHAISLQLRRLAEYYAKTDFRASEELNSRLQSVFSVATPLPVFDPNKLELNNRGRDDLLQSLAPSLSHLYALKSGRDVDGNVLEEVIVLTKEVVKEVDALYRSLRELTVEKCLALDKSVELYEMSKRYCALHAAAACAHMWIHNRTKSDEFFAKGEWLALCLAKLLTTFDPSRVLLSSPHVASVARELEKLYRQNRLFSLNPYALAQTSPEITTIPNLENQQRGV